MSQLIKSKYPAMEMPLLARHKLYNNQIQFCEELERRGKALIFRPSEALDSFQKTPQSWSATGKWAMTLPKQTPTA